MCSPSAFYLNFGTLNFERSLMDVLLIAFLVPDFVSCYSSVSDASVCQEEVLLNMKPATLIINTAESAHLRHRYVRGLK